MGNLVIVFSLFVGNFTARGGDTLMSDGGKTEVIAIESEPGLRAFAEAYIDANNTKDIQRIKVMSHPKDLAAFEKYLAHLKPEPGDPKPTVEEMLLQDVVPANHPPFIVLRYLKDGPLPQAGLMKWPVRPTHLLQFTYETSPNHSVTFMFHVARVESRWFLVEGVPTSQFIKQMTQSK